VPIRDSQMAAKKMELLLDQNLRLKMGENSRKYCEEKFDVNSVNKIIMSEVKNLFNWIKSKVYLHLVLYNMR
mgnify:CR=1